MIKGIIFDYGNVVGKDPTSYIYDTVSKTFRVSIRRMKREFSKFVFLTMKNRISKREFWKLFAESLGISDYRRLRKVWLAEFRKRAGINQNMVFLLRELRKNYKLGLLSNKAFFYRKASISKLMNRIFHVIINSHEVGMRKPEEKIYLLMLKKMNLKPEECLIIDDSRRNLSYPKKIGMRAIYFKSFKSFKSEFNKLLDK